ncbi:MAG: hypothetical protein MUF64_11150 [Polyangiaceae bacterium]|jgi:hypothetical protein|nr:hypothetical protein [Polyangiaceae bacterium]
MTMTFQQAVESLPKRIKLIEHSPAKWQRENAHTGNGQTLYSRHVLAEAAADWAKRSPSLRAPRWSVVKLQDGRRAIVDTRAKKGAPPEFMEPLKNRRQAFAFDATR